MAWKMERPGRIYIVAFGKIKQLLDFSRLSEEGPSLNPARPRNMLLSGTYLSRKQLKSTSIITSLVKNLGLSIPQSIHIHAFFFFFYFHISHLRRAI